MEENKIKIKKVPSLGFINFFLIPDNGKDYCFVCGALTHFYLKGDDNILDFNEEIPCFPCCYDQICYDLMLAIFEENNLAFTIPRLSSQTRIIFEADLEDDDSEFCIAFDDDFSN